MHLSMFMYTSAYTAHLDSKWEETNEESSKCLYSNQAIIMHLTREWEVPIDKCVEKQPPITIRYTKNTILWWRRQQQFAAAFFFSMWRKPREISVQPAAGLKAVGWAFLWQWQARLAHVQCHLHWRAGRYRAVGWGGAAHWPCSSHCSSPSAGSAEGGHATFSSASCAWNTETILVDKRKAAAPSSMLMLVIII